MTYTISTSGLALIQEQEGFLAEPRQLPSGDWLVGHGHVRPMEPGEPMNEAEAREALTSDLAPVEKLVNALVTRPLTQAQYDALVSFAFSIGAAAFEKSQVLRRVNAGEYVSAACAMDAWRKSDASGGLAIVDSLVRRRAVEKALFLSNVAGAPSVLMRAQLDHAAAILGAPVAYAATPALGSLPSAPKEPDAGKRLTEILRSEPVTEELLLTQVVVDEPLDDGEITTAHAKPVARFDFEPRTAPRRGQPMPERGGWLTPRLASMLATAFRRRGSKPAPIATEA